MAYDVFKDVGANDIKTSSKHLLIIGVEYVIEGNEALSGVEGSDVQQLVLNYQKIRTECLNFRNVYRLLGKQYLLADNTRLLDPNYIPQIGRDLEERNRQLTLAQLKTQGEEYRDFNQKIIPILTGKLPTPPSAQ